MHHYYCNSTNNDEILCTAGEITAVIVGVVCSLAGVCIILVICLLILLKMYHNGMNRHSSKI